MVKLNENSEITFDLNVIEALALRKILAAQFKSLKINLHNDNLDMFNNIWVLLLEFFNIKVKGLSTLFGMIGTNKESKAEKIIDTEKKIDTMKSDIDSVYNMLRRVEEALGFTLTEPYNFNEEVKESWRRIKIELSNLNISVPDNLESQYESYKRKIIDDYNRFKNP